MGQDGAVNTESEDTMRMARIKNAPNEPGFYHIICRTVGKAFFLEEPTEKDRLLLWLYKAIAFCGVELRAWCIMSNHVHLLVKIPPRESISDAELDRRMRILYLPARYEAIMAQWSAWRRIDGNDRRIEAAKSLLRRRMYDISWFMKTFKQAAAQDYNARHEHSGSIWGGSRFKSVYLEGSLDVQLAVAAYIHLNPVRAGMVDAPDQYRWSSWADACAHPGTSREGLLRLYAGLFPVRGLTWRFVKAQFERLQANVTAQRTALADLKTAARSASSPTATTASTTPPPIARKLAAKSPEFTSSAALGSADFIQRLFRTPRATTPPPSRVPRRPHRHLLQVAVTPSTSLCTLCTKALGRPSVAYTKHA